jgi:hypothetical protein
MIDGIAAGNTTMRKISRSDAPSVCAARMSRMSTNFMPSVVVVKIGKNAE